MENTNDIDNAITELLDVIRNLNLIWVSYADELNAIDATTKFTLKLKAQELKKIYQRLLTKRGDYISRMNRNTKKNHLYLVK